MEPSEVRNRVLADHETLRAMISTLEAVARQVLDGERSLLGSLRLEGDTLLEQLKVHMSWEDQYLRPALLAADAWGRERAELLDDDHREQRELLEYALASVQDQSLPAPVIARQVLDLVVMLGTDMDQEEALLLDERILRDDVVAIDVEAG